jgi:hypothetical protein
VVDGQRDERRADDAEHELQLPAAHGAGLARAGPVGGVRPHPRLDVGAAEPGPPRTAAAPAGEHLLRDRHLQHRVQRVIALQVRAELPHQTARAQKAHGLPLTCGAARVCGLMSAQQKVLRSRACLCASPSRPVLGLGGLVPVLMGRAGSWQVGPFFIFATSLVVAARSAYPLKFSQSFSVQKRFRRACAHTTTCCPFARPGPFGCCAVFPHTQPLPFRRESVHGSFCGPSSLIMGLVGEKCQCLCLNKKQRCFAWSKL